MKKSIATITAVLVATCLAACAGSPAVDHSALQNGSHRLSVQGEVTTGQDTLMTLIENKAAKICGKGNYIMEAGQPAREITVPGYVNGEPVEVTSLHLTRTVWCKS